MQTARLHELSAHALTAVQAASDLLSRYFANLATLDVSSKTSDADLVSRADREAEDLLRARLLDLDRSFGFVGEESSEGLEPQDTEFYWCVDPLDGTSNYLAGLPIWSVSVALCTHNFEPLIGIIASPTLGRLWHAVKGEPPTCNGRPMQVRPRPPGGGLANAMLATGFPYDIVGRRDDVNIQIFGAMQTRFQKIRRMGSAAIDLALVAEGVFDGMWEARLRPWDSAAGTLLVQAAGGYHSRYDGSAYTPGHPDMVAAATPELLGEIQAVLREYVAG